MGEVRIINPWYIVGFVDGEGCFSITLSKHKTKKTGYDPRLCFEIELRGDDRPILETIKSYFGVGDIFELKYERYGWKPHVKYAVRKHHDVLYVIIPFFKKYRLLGKKGKDFDLFCQAAELFKKKEHLTISGVEKMFKLREFMNDNRPFGK